MSVGGICPYTGTDKQTINIHKPNNTKNTVQVEQSTVSTNTHITKTIKLTNPHITKFTQTHPDTLENIIKQTQYQWK